MQTRNGSSAIIEGRPSWCVREPYEVGVGSRLELLFSIAADGGV